MRYFAILIAAASACCGSGDYSLPALPDVKVQRVEQAKELARGIAAQSCKYVGYNSLGDDIGEYKIECDHGRYALEITQSHVYERDFKWEVGESVHFRYREDLLIKPVYAQSGKNQDLNPVYHLQPYK